MQALDPEVRVRDFLLAYPGAYGVLEQSGLDCVAEAERSLAEACERAGLELSEVAARLERALEEGAGSERAVRGELLVLIDEIARDTDRATAEATATLPDLVAQVLERHGASHPTLEKLAEVVLELLAELEAHRQREEGVLFPYLRALVEASESGDRLSRPAFETAARPIQVMRSDHDATRTLLREIALLSDEYRPPAGASASLCALYRELERHARLILRHAWVEDELLYPRALVLEAAVMG